MSPPFDTQFGRRQTEAFRAVAGNAWRAQSLGARLLALGVLSVMLVIGLLVVALGLVIGVPLALGAVAYFWLRARWRSLRAPNGPLDGRENVRVIRRAD